MIYTECGLSVVYHLLGAIGARLKVRTTFGVLRLQLKAIRVMLGNLGILGELLNC
jgi:hypothetical protein